MYALCTCNKYTKNNIIIYLLCACMSHRFSAATYRQTGRFTSWEKFDIRIKRFMVYGYRCVQYNTPTRSSFRQHICHCFFFFFFYRTISPLHSSFFYVNINVRSNNICTTKQLRGNEFLITIRVPTYNWYSRYRHTRYIVFVKRIRIGMS